MRRLVPKNCVTRKVENWAGSLKNVPAFIVGNGPYLKNIDISVLDDKYFTIGINRAFLKIDPIILVWQDMALWLKEKKAVKKIKALKYCRKGAGKNSFYQFNLIGMKSKLTSTPSIIYGRGSSGPVAFQLAYALGCDPIILLGMDCKKDKKGRTNFYGNNPMHRHHTLPNCVKGLNWIRKSGHNREIINCSKNDVFGPKYSLEEALKKIKDSPIHTREEWVEIITKHKI